MASLSTDASTSAQTFFGGNTVCNSTKLDSVSRQSAAGAETIFGFKAKFSHKLFCNTNNQPDNMTTNITYGGYFNGPRLFVTNTGSTSFVVAGLTQGSLVYAVNGSYNSTGTFKVKADTTNNGTINIGIVVTNLLITKATGVVASGTTTVTVTGNVPKKGAFSATGNVVFNGSGIATLTINGNVYKINLLTGVLTKQ